MGFPHALLNVFVLTLIIPLIRASILNQIDICWRTNPNWASDRQALADCALGFGSNAQGGKSGSIYVVTDPSDDPVNPKSGTLRYGAIQTEPLWIIFDRDMTIKLSNELMINSYKTLDGRGAKVEITGGPCLTIQGVSHVIIHGLNIHGCTPGKSGMVRDSPSHVGGRSGSDGDAIVVFASSDIWVDHCSLASCYDGLIDVIHGSTAVTISNCYFANHNKVMLLGHDDSYSADTNMKVTVAFNHFGSGLVQRMPRVRWGYAHVVNNMYDPWEMYAIGGSADSTILSQGNYFHGSSEVTKRDCGCPDWTSWGWRSAEDTFVGGASFVQSGSGSADPGYSFSQRIIAVPGVMAPMITADAGVLNCVEGSPCAFNS